MKSNIIVVRRIRSIKSLVVTFSLFSIIFLIMYVISNVESNYAISMLVLLLSLTSYTLIYLLSTKSTIKEMLFVNSIFTLVYMLNMLITYYFMIEFYNRWDVFLDENRYFTVSIMEVSNLINSGSNLFDIADIFKYSETALYLYLQGYIVLVANYFDHASILTLKLFNVYIAALIPTVLFYLLTYVVNKREAFYGSFIYGLLSFNFAYSSPLLRDGLGAFLYILIFYYYLLPTSNKNLFFIFLISILSYYLRPETGMFAFLIAFSYLYFRFDKLFKSKILLKLIVISILLPLSIFLLIRFNSVDIMTSLAGRYGDNALGQASSDSLGSALLKLPLYIRLPLKFIQGQITYFPPWSVLAGDVSFIRLPEAIASISWPYVWPLILVGIIKEKLLLILDKKIIMLFLLSVGYIFISGSVATNPRQLMYVYPVIFLVAIVSFLKLSIYRRKQIIFLFFIIYLSLIALYLFLKYLR